MKTPLLIDDGINFKALPMVELMIALANNLSLLNQSEREILSQLLQKLIDEETPIGYLQFKSPMSEEQKEVVRNQVKKWNGQ